MKESNSVQGYLVFVEPTDEVSDVIAHFHSTSRTSVSIRATWWSSPNFHKSPDNVTTNGCNFPHPTPKTFRLCPRLPCRRKSRAKQPKCYFSIYATHEPIYLCYPQATTNFLRPGRQLLLPDRCLPRPRQATGVSNDGTTTVLNAPRTTSPGERRIEPLLTQAPTAATTAVVAELKTRLLAQSPLLGSQQQSPFLCRTYPRDRSGSRSRGCKRGGAQKEQESQTAIMLTF